MKKNFILITVILLSFAGCNNSKVYYMKHDNSPVYRGTAGVGGGVKRRLGEEVGKTFKDMPAPFDMEAEIDGKKYRRFAEEYNDGVCKWVASENLSEKPEKTGLYDGMYYALKPDEKVKHSHFMFQNDISMLLYSKEEAVLMISYYDWLKSFLLKGKYEVSGESLTIKINEVHKKNKTQSGYQVLPSRDLVSKVNTVRAICRIENQKLSTCRFYDSQYGNYQKNKEYLKSQSDIEEFIKISDQVALKKNYVEDYKIYKTDNMVMYSGYD